MKRLPQLDFLAAAPRPWPGIALAAVAAVLLLVSALSAWRIEQDNRQALAQLNERAARLLPPAPRKLSEAERVRHAQAARVAAELRAPWAELLATFEQHGHTDIGLLKLEPDAKAGVVRVTGQARSTAALFAYLRELEADPRLAQVALTTHQTERETPGQPLRFVIQAGWRAAREPAKDLS
ncbi:PilN domain-containing protein [Variovorax sp. YR752]|uniref:PilN domain-containing protein n=1 Tax=Variovorax sp. YR752 TaxID=1884383 RepID=UPI0031378B20